MKLNWKNIHNSNKDWEAEINHKKYGKYIWITETNEGYNIEVVKYNEIEPIKTCKTLTSAKRWVSTNLK